MTEPTFPKLPESVKTADDLLGFIQTEVIDKEPLRYNQHDWLVVRSLDDDTGLVSTGEWPSCGTVGCVAGWVVALMADRFGVDPLGFETMGTAERILGIEGYDAQILFSGSAADKDPYYHVHQPEQTRDHADRGISHIAHYRKRHHDKLTAKMLPTSKADLVLKVDYEDTDGRDGGNL